MTVVAAPTYALPLSFAQERLWFLDQLEPGSAAYSDPTALRLRGTLDVASLERALSEIVRRHEVLRTTFTTIDGEPRQIVAEPRPLSLPVLDGIDLQHTLEAEAQRPFDLQRGPLLRARLLRITPQEHVLLLTLHHIVSDGWSTGILVRELESLYGAFTAGEPSPLAELAIQYADYAIWQRDWLQGDTLREQLAYWTNQLAGARLHSISAPTIHVVRRVLRPPAISV